MQISSVLSISEDRQKQLMAKATELEEVFLSEMLSYTGLDIDENGFGGGIGTEKFASLLRHEQAKLLVKSGGIGLAETIFNTMLRAEGQK